jgi:predicted nucleotide-binding protein (sugar kinase/HSP70/actin superfamily)
VEAFARDGLFAENPVDLGSRCTVFMNSSVKQAQKEGASLRNISAGLSLSVVKNALYKVIRAGGAHDLGQHIVVQGGTLLNDAVLRAFELETGREVTRPAMAGLMGAYGAALYARDNQLEGSTLLGPAQLQNFTHKVTAVACQSCSNHCMLTVNTFDGGRRFIGGNRCEKPLHPDKTKESYNLYAYKRELLSAYGSCEGRRETVGLPMGLNFFELLPFWHSFFRSLGFGVRVSPPSSKDLYLKGQGSIPSDTACYPAKLMHGHIEALLESGVDAIFYPCMTYTLDEGLGDNHFNCPIVAYYPEIIAGNMKDIKKTKFIHDYVGLHRRAEFPRKMRAILRPAFGNIPLPAVRAAAEAAWAEYESYMAKVRKKGEEYLAAAEAGHLPVIVLAGRPYHIDGEINHGIDSLICDTGAVLISEDALGNLYEKTPVAVLDQWTYHARLYAAARYVASRHDLDINLVQLVSFGCGIDAITTDEVRGILERGDKIYTQIKIDEITNLGAVKIRLRSLFAAAARKERRNRLA